MSDFSSWSPDGVAVFKQTRMHSYTDQNDTYLRIITYYILIMFTPFMPTEYAIVIPCLLAIWLLKKTSW